MSYYIIVGLVCVLAGLAAGYLVAKKMKEENLPLELIEKITELTKDEIEKL